jgi:UDP-galactopyranose mutase
MTYDVLVVGSGLAGATAARLYAEKGKSVLVIEKRKQIGGNCYDYMNEHGLTVHLYGPHIFHTNNKPVWDFLNRFTKFNSFQHQVLSFAEGRLIPFPINRDTVCDVYGVDIPVDQVHAFLAQEVNKATFNNPPENFRDAVVSQVGERMYELFFKNYTKKQWEKEPEELSAEIANRIPIRENRDPRYFSDKYQGVPVHGYTKMIENILSHDNISLMLNTDYFKVNQAIKADLTVYTGLLDTFFDSSHGDLVYRSVDFQFETLEIETYQPAAVVNYPNDYDFTRITEFKHMTGEKNKATTLCYEYPAAKGEPCYVVIDKENMDKREKYLKDVQALEATGKLLFVGRLAEYKYYNMDQVVDAVMKKIQ